MNKKYGQIAENKSIDSMIYFCFEHILEEDRNKFVKLFREQYDDSDLVMHTFRELVLGTYFSLNGFHTRYEYEINNLTPDWSVLDVTEKTITGFIEVMSFHLDQATESEIKMQLESKGYASYWRDKNKDNVDRLYFRLWEKSYKYKQLVNELEVPYLIGVFPQFDAIVDLDEVELCLRDDNTGLFDQYPEVSGVLFFEQFSGKYVFDFIQNEKALRKFWLKSGHIDLPAA